MAVNADLLRKPFRRPSDKNMFLAAAIAFPLLVLVGYFKSYYFSTFFDVKPVANSLVHLHGIVMTLWVVYFTAQVALARSKNIKLHMSLGFAGIVLAALVVIVCLATAYDAHIVRLSAPTGINPYSFLIIPLGDLAFFILFFASAIYYRKSSAEHKTLMLMTAVNFLAPALGRLPFVPPEYLLLWTFGVPCLLAILCLAWHTAKHRKLNKIFAVAVFLFVVSQPLRIAVGLSESWIQFVGWIFS